MKVDLLVTGRIATLAGRSGFGWAEALAIVDGRVRLVGDRASVEREVTGATRRLALPPDAVAIPGLSDAHLHLADHALAADEVDLSDAPTLAEGLRRIAAGHAGLADPDAWLEGHGWDAVRWGGWPTSDELDRAAPGRKVALWAHDHHSVWASGAALAAAGVGAGTPDPPGGVIRRFDDGRPAGVLQEAAATLVLGIVPPPAAERFDHAVERACRELVTYGLVAVHDPGEVSSDVLLAGGFAAYERLGARGRLPLRVHACVRPESLELAIELGLRSGAPLGGPASRARVGWIKIFSDGTLGARTARMLAPYEPDPARGDPPGEGRGVDVTSPDEVRRLVARAAGAGLAAQVHAIGDRANRTSLEILAAVGGGLSLMPRIEHAQLLDPADLPRFARDGIAASVMPRDIRSDEANARRFWGDPRVEAGGYAYGSLVRSGAVVCLGTDAPVEPPDPWPAIAAAVTRRDPSWPREHPSFVPDQAIELAAALRGACLGAAISAGETDRGRLVPGARADLAVIPAAALAEPVEPGGPLETCRPSLVLIDGETVAEAPLSGR